MPPFDLFISYARKDNQGDRVTELVQYIRRSFETFAGRELQEFFDKESIRGMEDWRQRILGGLRESHLLLACVSPHYLDSEYCKWEFNEFLKREVARGSFGSGVAPIYFVEVPGWTEKDFQERRDEWVAELRRRQQFDLRPWFDEGQRALEDHAVRTCMQELNQQVFRRIDQGRTSERRLGNVYAHNRDFVGRVADLRRLRENFSRPGSIGVLTAVHGLGGVGKTALAVEYAHSFSHEYGGGRWLVHCEGRTDLRDAVATLASTLGIEFSEAETANVDQRFERVLSHLRRLCEENDPARCLLILDNVDRAELLDPSQSQSLPDADWIHVLATTRLGENELGDYKDREYLPVDELPEDEALLLIETHQPGSTFHSTEEREAAREIVKRLGGFTLAVEVAAVYLSRYSSSVSCGAYLELLQAQGVAKAEDAATRSRVRVAHRDASIRSTLQPTIERLSATERWALTVASFLPSEHIVLSWVKEISADKHVEIVLDEVEPGIVGAWTRTMRTLLSLRLLQATGVRDATDEVLIVRMHRMVADAVRAQVNPREGRNLENAISLHAFARAELLPRDQIKPADRWEVEPIVAYFWQAAESEAGAPVPMGLRAAGALKWLGRLLEAKAILDHCCQSVAGKPSPGVMGASCYQILAVVECDLGNLREAETAAHRSIRILQAIPGTSENLVHCYSVLGNVQRGMGRVEEADSSIRRAIHIHEQLGLPEDISFSILLSNLANLSIDRGDSAEARELLTRTVEIQRTQGGESYPNLTISLTNLSRAEHDLQDLASARRHVEDALRLAESIYPLDHPGTAGILSQLAAIDRAEGNAEAAEATLLRTLRIRESTLPPTSPDLAETLAVLSTVQVDLRRLDEAREHARRSLEIMLDNFPDGHPDIGGAFANLGRVELAAGNDQRAAELFTQSIAARHQCGLEQTWEVASAYLHRGQAEHEMGRYGDAAASFEDCIQLRSRLFGDKAEELTYPLALQATSLMRVGNRQRARDVAGRAKQILDGVEPAFYSRPWCMVKLALVEIELGSPDEALAMARDAARIATNRISSDHERLALLTDASSVLQSAGEKEEAAHLMERVLAESSTSEQDELTLAIRYHNLAAAQNDLGLHDLALANMEKALQLRTTSMAPDHPDFAQSRLILGMILENLGGRQRLERARGSMETSIRSFERAGVSQDVPRAEALGYLGRVCMKLCDLDDALAAHEAALTLFRAMETPPPNSLAFALNELSIVLDRLGRPGDRAPLLEEAIKLREESATGGRRELAVNYHNLGCALSKKADYEGAKAAFERSLQLKQAAVDVPLSEMEGTRSALKSVELELASTRRNRPKE